MKRRRKSGAEEPPRRPQDPPSAPAAAPRGIPARPAILAAALAVAIAAVWWPVGRGGFLDIDDGLYLTANPMVADGLTARSIAWAFSSGDAANWHPLTWLSHLLDVSLFGMTPGPMHLVSAGMHLATAVLLLLFLARTTGSPWLAAATAALFAIHPLRVQSVAWAAERKDVLSGLLFAATLLLYARYARRPTPARYAAVAACLALGLMAKPMLVTVPFLLLLLDVWPLRRVGAGAGDAPSGVPRVGWARALLEKAPLAAMAAASSVVTFLVQQAGGAMGTEYQRFPPGVRLANAVWSAGWYLLREFVPTGLAVQYLYHEHPAGEVALAVAVVVGLSVAALLLLRRAPYLAVGWCWFLGMLVPVIGLVQFGTQGMADRYTYLPGIGLAVAFVWGIDAVTRRLPRRRTVLGIAAAAAIGTLAALTVVEIGYWRDVETLYRRALAVTKGNWLVHNNLSMVLARRNQLDEAIVQAAAGVAINVDVLSLRNLGTLLARAGRHAEAIVQFRRALYGNPQYLDARFGLANSLWNLGQTDQAEAEYRRIIAASPGFSGARNNLGVILARRGRLPEAKEQFREAVRTAPANLESADNLADALALTGERAEAAEIYRWILARDPGNAGARQGLDRLDGGAVR